MSRDRLNCAAELDRAIRALRRHSTFERVDTWRVEETLRALVAAWRAAEPEAPAAPPEPDASRTFSSATSIEAAELNDPGEQPEAAPSPPEPVTASPPAQAAAAPIAAQGARTARVSRTREPRVERLGPDDAPPPAPKRPREVFDLTMRRGPAEAAPAQRVVLPNVSDLLASERLAEASTAPVDLVALRVWARNNGVALARDASPEASLEAANALRRQLGLPPFALVTRAAASSEDEFGAMARAGELLDERKMEDLRLRREAVKRREQRCRDVDRAFAR
jgi:hypothetical protein